LLSLASKNPGEDIEVKSWRILDEAEALRFSIYAAMLLMTANNAG